MQTAGFYCPDCQMKYVRHRCKNDTLPCEHDFKNAVFVYAKHFGKSGSETVEIVGAELNTRVWISKRKNSPFGWELSYKIETVKDELWLIDWIKQLPSTKYVQAFLKRWDSFTDPPDWRRFELWSEENIKEAKRLWKEHRDNFFRNKRAKNYEAKHQ